MILVVEKNIPMPRVVRCGKKRLYPFEQMEVGDSFAVANKRSAMASINHFHRVNKEGPRFSFRTLDDGTFRVWRVS